VNILQVELNDFYCRFAEAGVEDTKPVGWALLLRRGGTRHANQIDWFTPTEEDWDYVPASWEPT
jgi:hypothetical protein